MRGPRPEPGLQLSDEPLAGEPLLVHAGPEGLVSELGDRHHLPVGPLYLAADVPFLLFLHSEFCKNVNNL